MPNDVNEIIKPLLDKIDSLEQRLEKQEAENKTIVAFNKALLEKRASTKTDDRTDNKDAKEKLNKYLEEV